MNGGVEGIFLTGSTCSKSAPMSATSTGNESLALGQYRNTVRIASITLAGWIGSCDEHLADYWLAGETKRRRPIHHHHRRPHFYNLIAPTNGKHSVIAKNHNKGEFDETLKRNFIRLGGFLITFDRKGNLWNRKYWFLEYSKLIR
jgi:hypothetical protein